MIHAAFPSHIGYPVRLEVGRGSYGAEGLKILAYGGAERLRVGNFTSVGPGATVLLGGEHRAAPAFLFLSKRASSPGVWVFARRLRVDDDVSVPRVRPARGPTRARGARHQQGRRRFGK